MPTRPVILADGVALAPIGSAVESEHALDESVALTLQSSAGYSSFAWSLVGKPSGSVAALGSLTGFTSSITADVAGEYVIKGVATGNDGSSSARVSLIVVKTAVRSIRKVPARRSQDVAQDVDDLKSRFNDLADITDAITGAALTITQTATSTNARALRKLQNGSGVETQTRDVINAAIEELEHTPRPINVKAAPYLATGLGVVNEDAAFSAAFAAAISQKRSLYIPSGVYLFSTPWLVQNATGLIIYGDGRGRTRLVWNGTAAYPRKYAANCSVTNGSTTLTFPSGRYVQADVGKLLFIRDAGALGNHHSATIMSIDSLTTLTMSSPAAATTATAFAQIMPEPLLWLRGCMDCEVRDMNIEGTGALGSSTLAEAVRISSVRYADSSGATLSQGNVLRRLGIGAVKIGIRIHGERDANNDFHVIDKCLVNNYDDFGITVEDSQAFHTFIGGGTRVVSNTDYYTGIAGCSTTNGQTTISFPSGSLTGHHEGQIIEIVGAGFGGGVWRGKVVSVDSATTATIDTTNGGITTTCAGTATLRRGPQASLYVSNAWNGVSGSVTMVGGFLGTNLRADVVAGNLEGAEVALIGVGMENSRALVETEVSSGAATMLRFVDVRWAGGNTIAEAPVVLLRAPGTVVFDNTRIGQTTTKPVFLSLNQSGNFARASVSMRATTIGTSLAPQYAFSGWSNTAGRLGNPTVQAPQDVETSYIDHPSGTTPIGVRSHAYGGSGAITLSFGASRALILRANAAMTITMSDIPDGFGSPVRLLVSHESLFGAPDGPFALTFSSPAITWVEGRTPSVVNSRAGAYDCFEFWRETGFGGTTTVYGRVIGQAMGQPHERDHRGNGDPNGVVTGIVGDRYTRLDGGAGTTLYVCETAGTNGWSAK